LLPLLVSACADELIASDWDSLSPTDWIALTHLAEAHGVAPLLHTALENAGIVPPPLAVGRLAQDYYAAAGRAELLYHELHCLQDALAVAQAPYLPLKGAALAWTVYPDPALRPMYDLDVLVQPGDLQAALRAAQTVGYRLDKLTHHAVLRGGPNQSISLELHWSLPNGRLLPADLFSELSQNPSPELFEAFTTLYCCAHLYRQHPENPRLIWLNDLRLLRQRLSDPGMLHRLADRLGLLDDLAALQSTTFSAQSLSPSENLAEIIRSINFLPVSTRARFLGTLLFPSPAYMRWRYQPQPDWLWPAYYPHRLFDSLRVLFPLFNAQTRKMEIK
jgi:hypothetical protein